MQDGLFWISLALAASVVAVTWAVRAWRSHPGQESPPASGLPKAR